MHNAPLVADYIHNLLFQSHAWVFCIYPVASLNALSEVILSSKAVSLASMVHAFISTATGDLQGRGFILFRVHRKKYTWMTKASLKSAF